MSNLAKLINATRGTRVATDLQSLSAICEVTDSFTEIRAYDCIEYKIGVRLGARVMVSESDSGNLPFAVERVKRDVIESVFGEFRADFTDLHRLIRERNHDAAGRKLVEIEAKMFDM